MQSNPYEPPVQDSLPIAAQKPSVCISTLRIGGVLAAIGAIAFVCCWVTFYQVFDGPAPFWFQLIVFVSAALVPLGITIAGIGASTWIAGWVLRRGGKISN
jgi:hypothetical protein